MADEALRWTWPAGNRRLLLKALLRSSTVVIVDVFSQNTVQRPLTEDQQMIQALLAHRANPALRKSIGIGSLRRREHDRDPFRLKHCIKRRRKLRVSVMDQIMSMRLWAIVKFPHELTRPLGHPRRGRPGRTAGQVDLGVFSSIENKT